MMHRESCVCGMDSLELFQVPPTNIALEDSKWIEYYPVSRGRGRFDRGNSSSTPVNNIVHSLFSEIDLSLNGKVITPGTDTYPYKAYLEKLLSYEHNTLNTQMKACTLWQKDTPGYMDNVDLADARFTPQKFDVTLKASGGKDTEVIIDEPLGEAELPVGSRNEGLRKRHEWVAGSHKIVLLDRLHLDLFQQEKFIPNGVDIRLRFNRTKSSFYMMTAANSSGKVQILSMLMWVRKVRPTPTVLNAINQGLNTETAKYPLRRVEVKTFTIGAGTHSKIEDHLFQGQMPKRIVVGLVANDAFNGIPTRNPFNFQNAGVKKLEISINGETITTRPYEPDFADNLYLRSYLSLYQGLGKLGDDWAPDVTLGEYKNGYTLWCIDFTKDQEAQLDKFHLIQTGNLRIELQFAQNTVETLNCVVYAEFDNLLEINKQREVSIDY
uniref:Uncharacterized protein F54H12.2-like n=1 Tax=Crassostrea virginica TaxID=6565 RepID=A0A8B8C8I4_CRAVI|nr:uncharacterized protein F54H12.2-like [Crassostrea virginica]